MILNIEYLPAKDIFWKLWKWFQTFCENVGGWNYKCDIKKVLIVGVRICYNIPLNLHNYIGTIHLRRRQIFTLFWPLPPYRRQIWQIFDPSPPRACRRLKWMVPIQKNISYKWKEFKLFQLLESFKKNVPMHHPSIKKSLVNPTSWMIGTFNLETPHPNWLEFIRLVMSAPAAGWQRGRLYFVLNFCRIERRGLPCSLFDMKKTS